MKIKLLFPLFFLSVLLFSCKKDQPANKPTGAVYVAGASIQYGIPHAAYWKDGSMVVLSKESSFVNSIYTDGRDVYASGTVGNSAVYWKNDSLHRMPESMFRYLLPLSNSTEGNEVDYPVKMVVAGKDVYICGTENFGFSSAVAVYWKNGVKFRMGIAPYRSAASAIALSGSDVYVSGTRDNDYSSFAVYWKNGSEVTLTDGKEVARATDIVVKGNDVYVAGWIGDSLGVVRSIIWKNGVASPACSYAGPNKLTSLYVDGSNVYVAGCLGNPDQRYAKSQAAIAESFSQLTPIVNQEVVTDFINDGTDHDPFYYTAQNYTKQKGVYKKKGVVKEIPDAVLSSIFVY